MVVSLVPTRQLCGSAMVCMEMVERVKKFYEGNGAGRSITTYLPDSYSWLPDTCFFPGLLNALKKNGMCPYFFPAKKAEPLLTLLFIKLFSSRPIRLSQLTERSRRLFEPLD